MSHHCHAFGCRVNTRPEMLMCRKHWFMVPKHLQTPVWRTYRVGQCDDKKPSIEWCKAADAAVDFVARREGHLNYDPAKSFLAAFHPGVTP